MIDDIERKKINCIITKDLSRLSRNNFEANYFIEIYFLEKEIRYISILDNVDTYLKNSNNEIIQFKTLINDWYSKDISRKVKSGIWARKEQGLYVAAKAPYGYMKDEENKNKLIINQQEAEIIKKIFYLYNKGKTIKEISEKLKNEKIYCPSYNAFQRNKNGEYGWNYSTILKILKNKVYLGHTEYGKGINVSYKSKKIKQIPREEWKIVKNTHEAIISQELFEMVQNKMKLNQKAKSKKHTWILNGIIYCHECGKLMQLKVKYKKDKKTISFMRLYCSSSLHKKGNCIRKYKGIELQLVTEIVISNINKKIKEMINSEEIEKTLKQNYKNKVNNKKELNIKEKQLEKINKIISSIYLDYKNGIIEEEDFKKIYNQEIGKRNTIKQNINRINNKKIISDSEIKEIIKKITDIKKWDKEQISDIIEKVEIDNNDNIYINYKYSENVQ